MNRDDFPMIHNDGQKTVFDGLGGQEGVLESVKRIMGGIRQVTVYYSGGVWKVALHDSTYLPTGANDSIISGAYYNLPFLARGIITNVDATVYYDTPQSRFVFNTFAGKIEHPEYVTRIYIGGPGVSPTTADGSTSVRVGFIG